MAHHVAKISDQELAKVIKADGRKTMTKTPGTVDFMSPESLANSQVYGSPMDVFICWNNSPNIKPRPTKQVKFDPKTRRRVALLKVQ